MTKFYFNYSKILLLLVFFGCFSAFSQGNRVTGTVTDESDIPLLGVNVVETGTQNGVTTDFDGNFEITLTQQNAELTFSYVGFTDQTTSVSGGSDVQISLEQNLDELEEVVIIGYGSVQKRDLIGAVGTVKAKQLEQTSPTGTLDAIQGRVAGVQIVSSSGQPGAAATIRIRGTSTFSGGTDPLYVVDGQQFTNIEFLNPADIKSIDILKDGASAAIYGSRAANGVVVITTKGGTIGKPKFNVDALRTYGEVTAKIPVANSLQTTLYRQLRGDGLGDPGGANDTNLFVFQNDTDFQEQLSRTSVRDRLNISLSGGTDAAKYYWSAGYLNHDGILVNTNFNRLSSKLNLDIKPTKWLNTETRITLNSDRSNTQGLEDDPGEFLRRAIFKNAFQQSFNPDGSLLTRQNGGETSPLSDILLRNIERRRYSTAIYQSFKADITKSLSFKTAFSGNFNYDRFEQYNAGELDENGLAEGEERNDLTVDWLQENILTWTPNIPGDKHHATVLGGISNQYSKNEFSRIRSDKSLGFSTDVIQTLNDANGFLTGLEQLSGGRTRINTGSVEEEEALSSVFGRASYDYDGKYLFSFTLRRDSSSKFGPANRTGYFPSSAIGWRFSDDLFPNSSIVNDAKVRYSYAITGNDQIGNNEFQTLLGPGGAFNGNGGIAVRKIGNNALKWEETTQRNIGLNLGLFNDRVTITADYYEKKTDDLLFDVPLPREFALGDGNIRSNLASLENKGFEFSINGTIIQNKNVIWNAGFNISTNDNEILKLSGTSDEFPVPGNLDLFVLKVGGSIGDFTGFKQDGVFPFDESNAFADISDGGAQLQLQPGFQSGDTAQYTLNGVPYTGVVRQKTYISSRPLRGGDLNLQDLDGKIDAAGNYIIDNDDVQLIGNGLAKYFGGFNTDVTYKNFNLALFFDYSFGADIFQDFDFGRNTGRFDGVTPSPVIIEQGWRQQGDITRYPSIVDANSGRRNTISNGTGTRANDFYVDNADFIKLRNIRLTYNVPSKFASKIGMSNASAYISTNNVITWTNYGGYDPEQAGNIENPLLIGLDNLQYPRQRELLLGLNLTF